MERRGKKGRKKACRFVWLDEERLNWMGANGTAKFLVVSCRDGGQEDRGVRSRE